MAGGGGVKSKMLRESKSEADLELALQFWTSALRAHVASAYVYCCVRNSEAQHTHLAVPREKRRHAWCERGGKKERLLY